MYMAYSMWQKENKIHMKKIFLLFSIIALLLSSCKKDNSEPEAPIIEFKEIVYGSYDGNGYLQSAGIVFDFKDKNGDIGRLQSELKDKCGLPVYDLYLEFGYLQNGNFVAQKDIFNDPVYTYTYNENCAKIDSVKDRQVIQFNRSLEYVEPQGINKRIEGSIEYHFDFDAQLSNLIGYPNGVFRIYIYDRERNKSNEIVTPVFIMQ